MYNFFFVKNYIWLSSKKYDLGVPMSNSSIAVMLKGHIAANSDTQLNTVGSNLISHLEAWVKVIF